jgi:hypothetical protein
MLFVACVNITGDNIGIQPKEKKHRGKRFTFPFVVVKHYTTENFKRSTLHVTYKVCCSIHRVVTLKSSTYEKNKFEHSGVYWLTCGDYGKKVYWEKGRRIKALFQYDEIFEVILDTDRHLTSLPAHPPSVANEKHHSP